MNGRTLFLEPIGGVSGDMVLGAAADLGLPLTELSDLLHAAGIDGFTIEARRDSRGSIGGTRVDVRVEAAVEERTWREIRALLSGPGLPSGIAARAGRIFGRIARAEAAIHGLPEDEVHFHEVGALDAIVDIVGAAWAVERLGAEEIFTRPPPMGSGLVASEHGPLPVPAPATLALLRGLPVAFEGVGELTTPTGAAILAECARFQSPGALRIERVGYGVGHAHWKDRPNLLRASLGETASRTAIGLLEAHVDDASAQLLGHLLDRLMEAGALDAGLSPLLMKKGRPGQRLTVVCRSADRAALTDLILRESTSLGVRWSPVEREELERRIVRLETPFGTLPVKLGLRGGEVWNAAPEYAACLAAARERRVPLKDVLAAAMAACEAWRESTAGGAGPASS